MPNHACSECAYHGGGSCPKVGGDWCTRENRWRKYVPRDIKEFNIEDSRVVIREGDYLMVSDTTKRTFGRVISSRSKFIRDLLTGTVKWAFPFVLFDRAGNVVGRGCPEYGSYIEEDT